MDMDIHGYPWICISMDIHRKSVDMDMDMDVKFHIHGNPENIPLKVRGFREQLRTFTSTTFGLGVGLRRVSMEFNIRHRGNIL